MPERVKVVVVDADAGVAAWWEDALAGEGWDVVPVSDAETAFQIVRKDRPGAVVVRATETGPVGLRLLKRLRSSPHTALVPVIVIDDHQQDTETFEQWGGHVVRGPNATAGAVSAAIRARVTNPSQTYLLAPTPVLEDKHRLQVLADTHLLDSSPEAAFDHVTRLAARLLDAPAVLMSLVDRDRQYFKSHVGVPPPIDESRETPLSHSFCQWVVSGRDELIIPDTREHPLFKRNQLSQDLGIVAYAGVPLTAGSEEAIGSFCAMDRKPRRWGAADLDALHVAASVVEGITALRRASHLEAMPDVDRRATVRAAGRAVAGVSRLLTDYESRLSEAEHDALVMISGELGRQLATL